MKILISFFVVFTAFFIHTNIYGQEECKVLMTPVSLHYQGDCKKGLADGKGEAYGVDYYQGEFKKGWPDGQGTYKWSTGEIYKGEWKKGKRNGMGSYSFKLQGKDTTIVGKWLKDKFIGSDRRENDYVITYKNNIGRITVTRIGDGNEVRLKFLRHGGEVPVSNLLLYGDSGTVMNEWSFQGFDNVDFPFIAKITFSVLNDFGAASLFCELRIQINKPGHYQVYIFP
ncbi:MAG: hypothetical protein GXO83_03385 [Chlorobi bacterium]|nr:hypothetical protein [Chlorobiota bacterium]